MTKKLKAPLWLQVLIAMAAGADDGPVAFAIGGGYARRASHGFGY
jgi:hypothetical protein